MKNKYYTPEIEEFHVGFEYYVCEGAWYKRVLSTEDYLPDHTKFEQIIKELGEEDKIRVKYLDREDIEACGWKYDNDYQERRLFTGIFCDKRGESKYSLLHIPLSNHVLIWKSDQLSHIAWDDKLTLTGSTVFVGTIRNKSEFKRIMKMLNIE